MHHPTHQMFLFPYAGGSSYSFNPLIKSLERDFSIVSLEMPGHGVRISERLPETMDEVVQDLLKQIIPSIKPPYAFYGHSLGAVTAYLCILELDWAGLPLPEHLFLSGREGIITHPDYRLHHLPSSGLWSALSKLGGVPSQIMENKELRDFIEPILRADLKVIEEFTMSEPQPIPVHITVLLGEDDARLKRSGIQWEEVASRPFETHLLPGHHFFCLDRPDEVLEIVRRSIGTLHS